jgi:hypothetical protein
VASPISLSPDGAQNPSSAEEQNVNHPGFGTGLETRLFQGAGCREQGVDPNELRMGVGRPAVRHGDRWTGVPWGGADRPAQATWGRSSVPYGHVDMASGFI